jgi:hypothetical protein
MRLRLKGINCTRKKLASGEVVTYYYAWKGGPALRGQPGTPDFIQSYNEAIAQKVKPPTGTLLSVLQQPACRAPNEPDHSAREEA